MQRTITGFHRDDEGDWVASLSCLHRQHVRHRPPFREAPWVEDDEQRAGRVGTTLNCPLCDRAELPADLVVVRRTATWDEDSAPSALRQHHRVAAGTWGLLEVESGAVGFHAETDPAIDTRVVPGDPQPIPPDVDHHVEIVGPARFHVVFLTR